MPKLSVAIITKNEEKNIERCIDSVSFADEIVIVDHFSLDNTAELAESLGAVIYSRDWNGYGPAKQEAVNLASGKWILSLDADEAVSLELAEQIKRVIAEDNDITGYYIRRKTKFLGKWIHHCGWYPDYILRLFRKESGNFSDDIIHEKVVLKGNASRLNGEILHYCYQTLEQYLKKSNGYTTEGAKQAFKKGKRAGLFDLTIRPIISFISHYIFKAGFLDGIEGLIISALSAQAVFHKYAKLRRLNQSGGLGE